LSEHVSFAKSLSRGNRIGSGNRFGRNR
jgi:hypothetical protein